MYDQHVTLTAIDLTDKEEGTTATSAGEVDVIPAPASSISLVVQKVQFLRQSAVSGTTLSYWMSYQIAYMALISISS